MRTIQLRRAFALAIALAALVVACAGPTPTATPAPAPPTVAATATAAPTAAPAASPTLGPTVTPAASPTATPAPATATPAALTPTAGATASASPSAGSQCSIQPTRGFGLVYNREKTVSSRLRCPQSAETNIQMTIQSFQNGKMLQLAGSRDIIVLLPNGFWSTYPDTWQEGEALAPVPTPPAGTLAPTRGFGKLWRQNADVQKALGWATAESQSVTGAIQNYAGGRMLWTPDKVIYVLYSDNTWQSFADEFNG